MIRLALVLALPLAVVACGDPEVSRPDAAADAGPAIDPCPFNVQPNAPCTRPSLCCPRRTGVGEDADCVCSNGRWVCRVDAGASCRCRPLGDASSPARYLRCAP